VTPSHPTTNTSLAVWVRLWVCAQHTIPNQKVCKILRFDLEKVLSALDRNGAGKRAVSMTKQAANRIHLRNLSVIRPGGDPLHAEEHGNTLQPARLRGLRRCNLEDGLNGGNRAMGDG